MTSIEKRWIEYGNKQLKGKVVKQVRYMSREEAESMGWYSRPVIVEFNDGTLILPSSDDEGNGAGTLFGQDRDGSDLTFPVLR